MLHVSRRRHGGKWHIRNLRLFLEATRGREAVSALFGQIDSIIIHSLKVLCHHASSSCFASFYQRLHHRTLPEDVGPLLRHTLPEGTGSLLFNNVCIIVHSLKALDCSYPTTFASSYTFHYSCLTTYVSLLSSIVFYPGFVEPLHRVFGVCGVLSCVPAAPCLVSRFLRSL